MRRPTDLTTVTLAAWAGVLLAVAVVVAIKPGRLYPTFVDAGTHFRNGEPVIGQFSLERDLFRYSPTVAASFVPWGFLPMSVGGVLWRVFQAAALLLALRAWARVTVPAVPWPALALLVLPLSIGNFHNGQLNPIVCALMLGGVVAFTRDRYWLAAAVVAAATMFKIYPLSLGLLLCVVEPRRFAPRLVLALAAGLALPFALQSREFVCEQYRLWWVWLQLDDRTYQSMGRGYHDFQKLLTRWGLPTSLEAYRVMEMAAGALAAGFVLGGRLMRWDRAKQVHACAVLGLTWCTLFGPSTESATYMLLAPVAAFAAIVVTGRPLWERVWVRGCYMLLLSANVIQWFPSDVVEAYRGTLIPQAHAALFLLVWLVWRLAARAGALGWRQASRPAGEATPTGLQACPH